MPCTDCTGRVDLAHGVPALHPERKGALNVSPKANWVEKKGGLPPYINSVATALVRGGMDRSTAIATAVNQIKKTCATGHWGGRPNAPVSPAIKAAACSAVTRWEAMKLTAEDIERIDLAASWDPAKHPRDPLGLFTAILRSGRDIRLPSGIKVTKTSSGFAVHTPSRRIARGLSARAAAKVALAAHTKLKGRTLKEPDVVPDMRSAMRSLVGVA